VDSALRIRDLLQETLFPTIALVTSRAWSAGALIAIACRHIVMAPGSSIGAAEPIPATEKNIAALKSEFSTTAANNGYNPRIAEAMVDKKDGLPGYADAGEILALTDVQARELNLSEGTADTAEEALHLFSMDDAAVYYEDKGWKDDVLGLLQNEYVRMLFVGLILAAVLIEIKTAGIGVGLVTALPAGRRHAHIW
jgi:membrane-bound serine protease (ClpP class)